jgi:hypothetical protein
MKSQTQACQNCKANFTIDPEDFAFYEKIGVPAPTFCPECRIVRRGQFRNEWNFYKRPCSLCHKDMISIYSNEVPFPVYCPECYWSDKWDPLDHGRDYDFSKSFFEQFKSLSDVTPRIAIMSRDSVNSPYTHLSSGNKNGYLLVESSFNENLQYGYWMQHTKDSIDNAFGTNLEICYQTIGGFKSYNVKYSEMFFDSSDSWFLKSCIDCHDCFGCINLLHKKYCFLNEQLSKEEYTKRLSEMRLDTYEGIGAARTMVDAFYEKYPNRPGELSEKFSPGSTGNYISDSTRCRDCFYALGAEDCRYSIHILINIKDCYDVDTAGLNASLLYESMNTAISVQKVFFSNRCWTGHDIFYSESLDNSENCFGCISLNKKSYCILNKQYSKEEYQELMPKVIEHMKQMPYRNQAGHVYSFGEFFPSEFSVFGYNQTVAQDYFPLTEKEAIQKGYRWIPLEAKNHEIAIEAADLSDDGDRTRYLNKNIGCLHGGTCEDRCTKAYRLTAEEVAFYDHSHLPLPRLCPNCRHSARIHRLNSFRLYERTCACAGVRSENGIYANTVKHIHGDDPCGNRFKTSYHPADPRIIYCEQCYQTEVA